MTKPPALKGMRFWSLLLLGTLAVGLIGVNEARAAITYQTPGAVAYSSAGTGATSVAPAYPASVATGDLLVLIVGMKPSSANSGSVTTPTGWTAITSLTGAGGYGTTLGADTGNTNVFAFYKIAAGGETGTLTVTLATNDISWAQMYRLSNATGGWSVAGTTGSDTTGDGTVSIAMSADPGVTAGDYILGAMVIPTDVTTPSQFSAEALSQAGITFGTVTEISEPDSSTGNDIGGFTFGAPVSSGTATAAPTLTATAGGTTTNVRGPGVFIRIRETASTTLGNGTDPGSVSLAPGGAATMADAFTFQTTSGTDTITAVVVGIGTGASTGLSLVEITDDAGTTVYGSVTNPASDTPSITLSTNTLTATTTSTQYKIRITPYSHAAMPAPPGSTYSVTAKINSWTSTNTAAGSDTAGTTITIDNLSPGNVTAASGTAGNTQVVLTWTNPVDADFNSTVVLRSTTGAVTDTPVEGTTYTVGNIIGSSTVVSVTSTTTFTDTGLTNGTAYDYKIFTRDTNGNYSATGVVPTGSPYTPAGPGCYSVATGNWSSSLTWASSAGGVPGTCPGTLLILGVPDSTTPVYINFTATSHTVTVDVSNAAASSVSLGAPSASAGLTIGSGTLTVGGSVTITGGTGQKTSTLTFTTGTLKVGGSITSSGATTLTWGTGTVEYNGTGAQTVTNYGYYNLTINKSSGTATTSGNITIGNNLTLTTGTLNIAANSCDRGTAGGVLTLGSGSLLQIAAANLPANYTTVSIATNSTVEYNPSFNMTVPAPGGGANYGNLLLSNSGNRTFNAAMTVAGNLTATGTVALAMNAGITVSGTFNLGSGTSMDAKTFSHTVNGNFTNNGTFTPSTSTVTFSGTSAQAITGGATSFYNVVFNNNSAGVTPSVDLSISGNFTNTAGFGAGTTTTTFNGTAAQTITATVATTFYNLVFNNSAGFTISSGNVTASNALTLTSGIVTTGTNTLIFSPTTTCSVTRTSGYVNGKLRKSFTSTQTACNFEVGDSSATTHYTPLNVSFAAVSAAGSLTVAVKGGSGASATADDHPQVIDGTAALDSANSINRYWMLVPAGGLTFSNATLTFTHLNDATWVDHDNTANVTRYIVKQLTLSNANCYTGEVGYTGTGSWSTATASGTQTVTQTAVTGVSTFGTNCSHFAIGRSTISSFLREREWIFQREINY